MELMADTMQRPRLIQADYLRATHVTQDVSEQIDDMFEYHPWNEGQRANGAAVRNALARAVKVIIDHVPPGPDRAAAIRKIREARMDANSAITHGGKY